MTDSATSIRRRKVLTPVQEDEGAEKPPSPDVDESSPESDHQSPPSSPEMVPAEVLDRSFRHAVVGAAVAWVALTVASTYLVPEDAFLPQESEGAALALGATSLVMGASCVTRGLALFFKEPLAGQVFYDKNGVAISMPPPVKTVTGSRISGAAIAGFFVQACSAVSNGAMAVFSTPTIVDPVTGLKVCLLRWAEWAPLAFLMAYLTAGMDADSSNGGSRAALRFGLYQGVSTLCGFVFPFLTPGPIWWAVMAVAIVLHLTLHPLLSEKTHSAQSLPAFDEDDFAIDEDPKKDAAAAAAAATALFPCNPDELERRERVKVAAQLIQLLSVSWTVLILIYFAAWGLQVSPATHAMMECSVEVLSKHLYLNFLLDAHHLVFDTARQEEYHLMSDAMRLDEYSCEYHIFGCGPSPDDLITRTALHQDKNTTDWEAEKCVSISSSLGSSPPA